MVLLMQIGCPSSFQLSSYEMWKWGAEIRNDNYPWDVVFSSSSGCIQEWAQILIKVKDDGGLLVRLKWEASD